MSNDLHSVLAPDVPWQTCYPEVARRVRAILKGRVQPVSTSALVETLFPVNTVEGAAGVAARARLFAALAGLVKHELACYGRRGQPERKRYPLRGGKGWRFVTNTPWLWADYGTSHSEASPHCPMCGQAVKPEATTEKGLTNA